MGQPRRDDPFDGRRVVGGQQKRARREARIKHALVYHKGAPVRERAGPSSQNGVAIDTSETYVSGAKR